MRLLIRWAITAISVAAAAFFIPGITIDSSHGGVITVLIVALVLGFANAVVRPILAFLSLGCIIATLGLFTFVINAAVFLIAAWISQQLGIGFYVDGFWPALFGSIIVSIVSFVLSALLPDRRD